MSSQRIVIVTGANKGIGLAIVRNLALQYPSSAFNNGPLLVYLTARSKERGETALESIQNDTQLKKASALKQHGGLTEVKYQTLDIGHTNSIRQLSEHLKREHPDGIDILINNAGIALNGFNAEIAKETIQCNYYGTIETTQTFLPHIRKGGRVVNVASIGGALGQYSDSIRQQFLTAKTVPEITKLMEDFKKAVSDGNFKEQGWPGAAYGVSKSGVIGFTRVLATDEQNEGGSRLINSCCPGYVDTDMTKHNGVKTPDQGAQTPVLLALGDIKNSSGDFWQDEKVRKW